MELEDLYPLSPLQQGLMYEAAAGAGTYVEHHRTRIEGRLDVGRYRAAWQSLVDRHPIMRTAVTTGEDGQPLQAVLRSVRLPVTELDWRGLTREEQATRLERFCANDREQGFDVERAPLMRLAILRLGDATWECIWTFHHMLLDGWSVGKLLGELDALYSTPQAALPTPRPYRDYIGWLAEQDQAAALSYWKEYLAGLTTSPELNLPPGDPDGPRQGELTRVLDADVRTGLQETARRLQVTPSVLIQAAWAVVLGRYSDHEDVAFGTTVSGRSPSLSGVEDMVGLFINSVPVRARLDPEQRVADLARRLHTGQVDRGPYEHTPLHEIQGHSEVTPGTPLFSTMCVYENFPDLRGAAKQGSAGLLGPDCSVEVVASGTIANYALSLIVIPQDPLTTMFLFDERAVAGWAVDGVARHFEQVLTEIIREPDTRIGDVTMIGAAEQEELLHLGRGPEQDAVGQTVHEVIAQWAARAPEQPAVIADGQGELCFGALDERAEALARALVDRGVRPGELVGVHLGRGTDLVIALLAALKAGAGYLPLDPDYPQERLAFIIDDARPAAVVTATGQEWESGPQGPAILDVDAHAPRETPLPEVGPDAVAYCLYTSGSTGRPKGALIEHRAVLRLAYGMPGVRLDTTCRMLQVSPVSFDASTVEIWSALLNGAAVVACPPGTPSIAELSRILTEHAVTTAGPATALANSVIDADPTIFRPLRQLIMGGEPMSARHVRSLLDRHPELEVFNGYGPTESTSFTTLHRVTRQTVAQDAPVPIGRPIGGTRVYLLDRHGRLVPRGVPGEVCIAGAGLARGYLGRPGMTADKFRAQDLCGEPGARLYRSGDRARWRQDGALEFLGRVDDQVKVRGHRVELGEVEHALRDQPGVAQAAAAVRDGRLGAYLVAEGERTDDATLRATLADTLPAHMVPGTWTWLEELPTLPNGKVDRAALPAPTLARPTSAQITPPRSEIEQTLAEIWAETLGVPEVGVHDNFLELGGDSIHAMQILARLREMGLTTKLYAQQLFERPTIAELAPEVVAIDPSRQEQGVVSGPLRSGPIHHWFFDQELGRPDHFNQAVMMYVPDDLDVPALQQALYGLLLHHDALRIRAWHHNGAWQLRLAGEEAADPAEVFEVAAIEDEEGAEAGEGDWPALLAVANRAQASLDLESGPSTRIVLATRQGRPHRLIMVAHHLGIDAASWSFLVQDLNTAYQQALRAERVSLPPKTTSLRQWLDHLHEHAGDDDIEQARSHWLDVEAGPLDPGFPQHDDPGPATIRDSGLERVVLSEEATHAVLQEAPAAYRARPDELVLTAVCQAVRACTGTKDVVVGMENNGRHPFGEGIDLSRTVGWFTATFPVLLRLPDDPQDTGGAIVSVKESLRNVPHHGLSHGMLRYLHPDPLPAADTPVISYNYLGGLMSPAADADLPFTAAPEPSGLTSHEDNPRTEPISVLVMVAEGRLEVVVSFQTTRFEPPTMQEFVRRIDTHLAEVVEHCRSAEQPRATSSDFPLAKVSQKSLERIAGRFG
jgi:amino acid adenylation domain-containing protein/non-ribosomal peptide synthase protein (TIGR01720 family)